MRKLVVSLLIALAIALVVVGPVMAQEAPDPPALDAFLESLASAAGLLATGTVVALILEQIEGFQRLASDTKWIVVLVVTVALGIVARLVLTYVPGSVLLAIEPYWALIAGGFILWLGSQVGHRALNK